jgi:hypothetical protein
MPVVSALCKKGCWDNVKCHYYYQGQEYQIDTDSQVAKLAGCWQFAKAEIPETNSGSEAAPTAAPAVKTASVAAAKKP